MVIVLVAFTAGMAAGWIVVSAVVCGAREDAFRRGYLRGASPGLLSDDELEKWGGND